MSYRCMAKGKQRLPVIDNFIYSDLIFKIAKGNNYAQKIFEAYKKKKPVSVIARQLDILEEDGFVTSETKEDKSVFPMQRLRIYSVNWEKINKEFFRFMEEKSTNPDFKLSEKFLKNKCLAFYFERIFSFNEEVGFKTIKEVFEKFSLSLLESLAEFSADEKYYGKEISDFRRILEAINPAEWENPKFIDKSEEILNKDLLQKFRETKENSIEATKPIENSPEKFRDTSQIKPSAKRKGDNENEK